MDIHQSTLQKICRSCGNTNIDFNALPKYRIPVSNPTYRSLLLSAQNIDVENEESHVFPKWICLSCKGKLDRWKKHSRNKSRKVKNIALPTPPQFSPHVDDCRICISETPVESHDAEKENQKQCSDASSPPRHLQTSDPPIPAEQSILEVASTAAVIFGYQVHKLDGDGGGCVFLKIIGTEIAKRLHISPQGDWHLFVYGYMVTPATAPAVLGWAPLKLTPQITMSFFNSIEKTTLCIGNHFEELCRSRCQNEMAAFRNHQDNIVGQEELRTPFTTATIRHKQCAWIIPDMPHKSPLCSECLAYKNTLKTLNQRMKKSKSIEHRTDVTSRVNFKSLSDKEKVIRFRNMAADRKLMQKKIAELEQIIAKDIATNGTNLDDNADGFVRDIIERESESLLKILPEDSPSKILWEQQVKYSKLKDGRSMRWHPLVVRWCFALQTKSTSAYKALRNSGFLTLPHPKTLAKYSNFTNPRAGFNPTVLKQIYDTYDLDSLPKEQRFIALLFDEIKIKSGLAFSKRSGRMVGFCDVGEMQNELTDFERKINGDKTKDELGRSLASHIHVLMARSICGKLHMPIAYFPTRSATSGDLYETVWKGVQALESLGLEVRAFVSDGASPNRKFYRMMQPATDHHPGYYTKNLSCPSRRIYFICDVPHLIKTTRNNWENSGCGRKSRKLIYNKQEITWQQLIQLKEWDIAKGGIHKLPKVTFDHLKLNPNTRMRVYMAAQVLSSSVAKAFESQGRYDTKSTIKFITFFDKFLDCLNVSNIKEGTTTRKPDLLPYKDTEDPRFKWLQETFLGFLDEWEAEGQHAPTKERKQFCLSRETLEGLRITVHSFVSLARELLTEGASYILSEKLTQDPLEEHFSKQRSCAGANTNPSITHYGDNETKIIYAATNSHIMTSEYGNCRNKKRRADEVGNAAKKINLDSQ